MNDTEFVRVRECPDGSHPEGDGVWIATRPSLDCGIAARNDMIVASRDATTDGVYDHDEYQRLIIRRWFNTYVRLAPVRWNLHDEDGEWPFDVERLASDFALGYPVADRADDFYRDTVQNPLPATGRPTSPNGQTAGSTSRPTTLTGKRRARSSRASTAGRPSVVRTA